MESDLRVARIRCPRTQDEKYNHAIEYVQIILLVELILLMLEGIANYKQLTTELCYGVSLVVGFGFDFVNTKHTNEVLSVLKALFIHTMAIMTAQ